MGTPRRLEVVEDAFPGETEQEPVENFRAEPDDDVDDEAIAAAEAAAEAESDDDEDEDSTPPRELFYEPDPTATPHPESKYERVTTPATLQDLKVSAASNGANYEAKFEIGIEGWLALSEAYASGPGGYDATWHQVHVGQGAEIKRMTTSRDADGNAHFWIVLHLPQSEIARSLGRLGDMTKSHSQLILDPMQGTLGLRQG